MKYYLSIIALTLMAINGYGQEPARKQTKLPSLNKNKSDVHYRLKRVWYQRSLGVDSATAIQLVKADEEKQQGISSAFRNSELNVSARALVLKVKDEEYQQKVNRILNREQMARLLTRSEPNENVKNMVTIKQTKDTLRLQRLLEIDKKYRSQLNALIKNTSLDSKTRQEKMKELLEEQRRSFSVLNQEKP